jgi:hypothetical protein
LLSLLHEGGVPDDQAAWGIDLLLLFATSLAAEHASRDGDVIPVREEAVSAALRSASSARYPRIAGIGVDLLSGPPEARYGWGIAVLLTGIATAPRPPKETS